MAVSITDVIRDLVIGTVYEIKITCVEELTPTTWKLCTPCTLYLRPGYTITINGNKYLIIDYKFNEYIIVEGTVEPSKTTFPIDPPFFESGTPQMVSSELAQRQQNGEVVWPLVWLVEIYRERGNLDPTNAVKNNIDCTILFLDTANTEQWSIAQHNELRIKPMEGLAHQFINIIKHNAQFFNTDDLRWTLIKRVNFGRYVNNRGNVEMILSEHLDGIEMQIDLPLIYSDCDCLPLPKKYCLPAKYENSDKSFQVTIQSGETYVSDDITLNVNGAPFGTFPTNQDISIQVSGATFLTNWTGLETETYPFDDGYNYLNGIYPNGILASEYVLLGLNDYGNSRRFTGRAGGYMNEDTGDFFLLDGTPATKEEAFPNLIYQDWAFRREWYMNRSSARNFVDNLNLCTTDVVGGESGWRAPSRAEIDTLASWNIKSTTYIDNRIFNWSGSNVWSCTPDKRNITTRAYRFGGNAAAWSAQLQTRRANGVYIKNF